MQRLTMRRNRKAIVTVSMTAADDDCDDLPRQEPEPRNVMAIIIVKYRCEGDALLAAMNFPNANAKYRFLTASPFFQRPSTLLVILCFLSCWHIKIVKYARQQDQQNESGEKYRCRVMLDQEYDAHEASSNSVVLSSTLVKGTCVERFGVSFTRVADTPEAHPSVILLGAACRYAKAVNAACSQLMPCSSCTISTPAQQVHCNCHPHLPEPLVHCFCCRSRTSGSFSTHCHRPPSRQLYSVL